MRTQRSTELTGLIPKYALNLMKVGTKLRLSGAYGLLEETCTHLMKNGSLPENFTATSSFEFSRFVKYSKNLYMIEKSYY